MSALLFEPRIQLIDSNGDPIVNGYIYTWAAGTTTPKDSYDDYAATVINPNPIRTGADGTPNSSGTPINVFLNGAYKIDIRDENDVSLSGYPVDNVVSATDIDFSGLTASIADLNSTDTSSIVKAVNYAVVLVDRGKTVLMNASSGALNVNLLAATTAGDGYRITIKKTDNSLNAVTIITNGAETIDIRSQYLLYDYNDFIEILCDGSNWKIVAAQIRGTFISITTAQIVALEHNNHIFLSDASSAAFNITLPPSATVGKGFAVSVKKTDSSTNEITIVPDGAETIDALTTLIMRNKNDVYTLKTDGADWFVVNAVEGHTQFITGDVKPSFRTAAELSGWVEMEDTSIGKSGSGATARANDDTQDLFVLLWTNVLDAWAPVSTGRGATAIADFNASKTLTLPRQLGRALIGAGAGAGLTAYNLGEFGGAETVGLVEANNAPHTHSTHFRDSGGSTGARSSDGTLGTESDVTTTSSGSGTPHENRMPFAAINTFIKL